MNHVEFLIINFLENQFDIRLENLLIAKNSSIHHLESGMKNTVIQKKEAHLDVFFKRADFDKSGGVDLEEGTKFINNEIFPSKKLKNIKRAKSKAKS